MTKWLHTTLFINQNHSFLLTKKNINHDGQTPHGPKEYLRQFEKARMLGGVDDMVGHKRHVLEAGRVTDNLGVTQVNGVLYNVQKTKPALYNAICTHLRRKHLPVLLRWGKTKEKIMMSNMLKVNENN